LIIKKTCHFGVFHTSVKDKEGIKDPKSPLKMLILPNNCQFGSKFWISLTKLTIFS